MPVGEQIKMLSAGVDIITCTPGRLEDFIQSGKILLSNVRFFILDEAVNFCINFYTSFYFLFFRKLLVLNLPFFSIFFLDHSFVKCLLNVGSECNTSTFFICLVFFRIL